MLTHNGNLEDINDVGEITKEWLSNNNVKYDELHLENLRITMLMIKQLS